MGEDGSTATIDDGVRLTTGSQPSLTEPVLATPDLLEPDLASHNLAGHDLTSIDLGNAIERRRSGRSDVAPELLPLLRANSADDFGHDVFEHESCDDLRPVRGIAIGGLLSIPLWAGILAGGWYCWSWMSRL